LHRHAVALGRRAGLEGASTAEFLVDEAGRPWFLEVNTRLQVEHGVTELVTGIDLVHEQFRIAAGEGMSAGARAAARRATTPDGHAIEARLTAEDPADGFRPQPGRVTRWAEPAGPGIRLDSGVESGSVIPGAYDSLMAKILVAGPDREAAIARLGRALDELEVGGVQTDLPFLRFVALDPDFAAARVDTGYVERAWRPEQRREQAAEAAAVAAAFLAAYGPAGLDGAGRDPAAIERDVLGPTGASGRWHAEGLREATDRWP
jgi:acetyl-CoA/propionyl-CoA carboxylase biotin carboxyl carrier protein